MKFDTKFSPGDMVWFVADNKVRSSKVEFVCVTCSHGTKQVDYIVHKVGNVYDTKFDESLIFGSKQDLLDAL